MSRNGVQIAIVAASSTAYPDTVAPGITAVYSIAAVDATGVTSTPSSSNLVTTPQFMTGFDANSPGSLTGWTKVVNVSVQNQTSNSAPNAAALSASSGAQSFAIENLPSSSAVMYAQVWVDVGSLSSTTVTLFALRNAASQVARVFLQPNGALSIANNVDPSHPSYVSNVTLSAGSRSKVTLAIDIVQGTIQVWVGGTPVRFNTASGAIVNQNLGSTAMGALQLGDDSTSHTYGWYADDIRVSTVPPTL